LASNLAREEIAVMPDEHARVGGAAMTFRNSLNDFWNRKPKYFPSWLSLQGRALESRLHFERSRDCAQRRRSRDAAPSLCHTKLF
jgi:hypothetical protein